MVIHRAAQWGNAALEPHLNGITDALLATQVRKAGCDSSLSRGLHQSISCREI